MIWQPFKGGLLCHLLCLFAQSFLQRLLFLLLSFSSQRAHLSMLLLNTSIYRVSIMLMFADMPAEDELLSAFLRSLMIVYATKVHSLLLFEAFFVFCAFTILSARVRALLTSTWAEGASITASVSCTSGGGGVRAEGPAGGG
jgi:hypothetical protein